jgi:1-acyl-sn-glycerol-3-phosphate acyltransferase
MSRVMAHAVSPTRCTAKGMPGVLAPLARRIDAQRADGSVARDPGFIARHRALVRSLTAYFSPEVRGMENVPKTGPVLVVGNHNCVFYMPDVWVTALALVDRRGLDHPAYALAYDLLFALPVVGPTLRRFGALPARPESALAALAEGAAVVVYPGGDWESCRPWRDRNTVDFGGRTGFVRLALQTGVPIVPVVAHGSHDAVIVASRGEHFARALGLGGLRIKVFPIMVGPPFGLDTFLTPPLPLPSAVTVEFLPPMHFECPGGSPGSHEIEAASAEVTAAMQQALDRLSRERPHPVRDGVLSLARRLVPL